MSTNQIDWDLGGEQEQVNPLTLIHRCLRGRYILAIVLGLLFGVVGATLGYMSRQPLYKSEGMIRIRPSLPKVLYETEQSTAPKMFTSFVNTQAQLISDPSVVRFALERDTVKLEEERIGYRFDVEEVIRRLTVKTDSRGQEIIRVSYEDEDPRVSATLVNAILDAYIEKYGKEGSIKSPGIVNSLEARRRTLRMERDQIDRRIEEIVTEYKAENLEPIINELTMEINSIKSQRERISGYLKIHDQARAGTSGIGRRIKPETEEEAAVLDTRIAALIQQREQLVESRTQMMVAEGLREEHRDVRRITMMIENIQKSIDERMEQIRSDEVIQLYDEEGNLLPPEPELRRQLDVLNVRLEELNDRAERLFKASLELEALREDRQSKQASLDQVNHRLDMIETESKIEDIQEITGKISIASRPTPASEPTSDPRIKMAGAGFIGAGSLPVLVIMAIGYLSHRVNYSDDEVLTGARAGIVGMLPDLGNALDDQELASASAFAVHQIRSQLQIKSKNPGSCVYGVTSPAPGDGKTSLIIAMGLSFAESGSRTLLVDLDFIGRGLSLHFGHSRSPSLADRLTEAEEVAQLIHETEFPGLSILPAGYGDDLRVSKLSPRSLEAFLEPLRVAYDTILIDTGPILGSVEAAFVAPQADGVLLVVGRGQYKPLIKKAIDQIHAVDGEIVATIFNRASAQEIRHSTSSMSVHFSRQFSRQQAQGGGAGPVGPVASALFTDRGPGSKIRKANP